MTNNQIIKILLSGEGGQGIQTIAKIFCKACFMQNYEVCYIPHYGVEMRMGISLAYLQIGVKPITYPKFHEADMVLCMTSRDLQETKSFCTRNTKIINAMNLREYLKENNIPVKSLNMVVLGVLSRKFKDCLPLKTENILSQIKQQLGDKKGLEINLDAFMKGMNLHEKLYCKSLDCFPKRNLEVNIDKNDKRTYMHWPSHCKGCGLCIEKCPVKALSWSKDKINFFGNPVPKVDIDKCIACGICESLCPDMAIKVIKNK